MAALVCAPWWCVVCSSTPSQPQAHIPAPTCAVNSGPRIDCPDGFEITDEVAYPEAATSDLDRDDVTVTFEPEFEGLGVGETEVTATASDGSATASCSFVVVKGALALLPLLAVPTPNACAPLHVPPCKARRSPYPRCARSMQNCFNAKLLPALPGLRALVARSRFQI